MFRSRNTITLDDTNPKYFPLISFVIFAFACLQFIRGELPLFVILLFTYMYVDYVNLKNLKTSETKTKNIIIGIFFVKLLIITSIVVQKYL